MTLNRTARRRDPLAPLVTIAAASIGSGILGFLLLMAIVIATDNTPPPSQVTPSLDAPSSPTITLPTRHDASP